MSITTHLKRAGAAEARRHAAVEVRNRELALAREAGALLRECAEAVGMSIEGVRKAIDAGSEH